MRKRKTVTGCPVEFLKRRRMSSVPSAQFGPPQLFAVVSRTRLGGLAEVSGMSRHKRAALVVLLVVAGIAAGGWYYFHAQNSQVVIHSIAVLPFTNVSKDADREYLSDGISESLINSLSQLPQLKVIARSSSFRYKGKDVDPQEVAKALGVEEILTGRVTQRGDGLVISAELVDARDRTQVWGEQYNRKLTDLPSLQSEIARDVSEKLHLRLTSTEQQRLTSRGTENTEAYQAYLKGRYYWNRGLAPGYEKSRDYYQQAIDLDPATALVPLTCGRSLPDDRVRHAFNEQHGHREVAQIMDAEVVNFGKVTDSPEPLA
jgi:TolB-like protein